MQYDLFISYSRKDNVNNRITDLIEIIKQDYQKFSKEELKCFFDTEEIKVSEDWEHRILQGLRDSHLLLIILTPNYLSSPYCEWEIIEYLKYEYSRGVAGDGVTQVYFLEIPGIDTDEFKKEAAQWLNKLGSRQRIDFRPWNEEGSESLKNREVKKRLKELNESIRNRIVRKRIISNVDGNIPAPNPKFVGRETEMKNLHKYLDTGKLGVITAVHGVGGLGKTAIAFQYAWAFGDFYPGGAWYISCANQKNLATVIKSLSSDLNITFSEDEQKDEIKGAKRILNALKIRAEKGVKKTKENIKAAVLLILDNVDYAELIEPPKADLISGKEWLKVLVTTRMGPKELHTDGSDISLLTIDELPFEDALSLIESYQRDGKFASKQEKEKAQEIVELLGGFTLAIEVAALYLKQMDGRCTCTDFVELLKKDGIDEIGSMTKKNISHSKLVSVTLKPTLDSLPPNEIAILEHASLLPPDSIPLPWLKALTEKEYPEFAKEDEIGKDNAWISAINHLLSIRLFKVVEMDDDGKNPRIVKMHRLVQGYVGKTIKDSSKKQEEIVNYVGIRANYLKNYGWINKENRWEMNPIKFSALIWINQNITDSILIANHIVDPLIHLGKFNVAKELCLLTLKFQYKVSEPYKPWLATIYSNLALVERGMGNFSQEKQLNTLALKIWKINPTYRLELARCYNNLASAERNLGNSFEAKRLVKIAIKMMKKINSSDHSELATSYNNLGLLEHDLGNFEEARHLLKLAIDIREKINQYNHPELATSYNNLAALEQDIGNLEEAKIILKLAIDIRRNIYEPDHPWLATSYNNLATLEHDLGNLKEAKKLYILAIDISEKIYEPGHPWLATIYNNLALLENILENFVESNRLLKLSTKIMENIYHSDHPWLATSYHNLAVSERNLGNFSEAKRLHNISITMKEKIYELEHPELATSYNNLATVEQDLGNFLEAKSLLKHAIEIREKIYGSSHPLLARSYNNLGNVERDLGNFTEAKKLYIRALKIAEKQYPQGHYNLKQFYSNLESLEVKIKEKKTQKF